MLDGYEGDPPAMTSAVLTAKGDNYVCLNFFPGASDGHREPCFLYVDKVSVS